MLTALYFNAQSVIVVDIKSVLDEMNDYKSAQSELDKLSEQYRQAVMAEQDKIKSLYNQYQAESVLMTEDMKKSKENEIMEKEKSVREMQKGYFGPEGQLFQKRQELVQPVENKVYAAIKEYTADRSVDLVFDKSSTQGLIFSSDKYDKTDDIKRKLGIKVNTK